MDYGVLSQRPNPDQLFARNSQWVKPGNNSYNTQLPLLQEMMFRNWLQQPNPMGKDTKSEFDPNNPKPDYDMRGFYAANAAGDPRAFEKVDPNDGYVHRSDYWKTPYHETFSNESQWATPSAPGWTDDDKLVTPGGHVIFDDRTQQSSNN